MFARESRAAQNANSLVPLNVYGGKGMIIKPSLPGYPCAILVGTLRRTRGLFANCAAANYHGSTSWRAYRDFSNAAHALNSSCKTCLKSYNRNVNCNEKGNQSRKETVFIKNNSKNDSDRNLTQFSSY